MHPRPVHLPVTLANAPGTSSNWAGYTATGQKFTSVSASWTQPTATCTGEDTWSSFWVGLDGDGSDTTEQTGSEADCSGGVPVYYSWYEMYPNAPVTYSDPVQPGDQFTASVTSLGSGQFALTITDATQGWTHTVNETSPTAKLASAEVIAEAPTGPLGVLPLTDFTTASFTGAQVNGQPIGASNPQALTMTRPDGTAKATPSALTGGTDFSVAWQQH
ncbi:G1 family glutamic endopeptidase [Streptacidiphilus melanogenes]|uniref:G1 family glutamic endopeptidase n=1 Tax=Streptacidiphilus melanogenes TaxID=411235 RepID=UPI0006950CC7|nr:G1 family glutamic endopeptidase [Streptacidiphilus melanogenes]